MGGASQYGLLWSHSLAGEPQRSLSTVCDRAFTYYCGNAGIKSQTEVERPA